VSMLPSLSYVDLFNRKAIEGTEGVLIGAWAAQDCGTVGHSRCVYRMASDGQGRGGVCERYSRIGAQARALERGTWGEDL